MEHEEVSENNVAASNSKVPRRQEAHGPSTREPINEEEFFYFDLKYGAAHVLKIYIPVSLCMIFVAGVISTIPFYTKTHLYLPYTPFHEKSNQWEDKLYDAARNTGILLTVIILMTFLLVCLYMKRCYLIIQVWLGYSTIVLLSFFSTLFMIQLLNQFNVGIDIVTMSIITWNVTVVGMISIHWKGPLIVQQGSLIYISALTASLFIKFIPEYTIWFILAAIPFWDLVAVLCPKGPLRMLVETAHERNDELFGAIIYSSGMVYNIVEAVDGKKPEELEEAVATENSVPEQRVDAPRNENKSGRKQNRSTGEETPGLTENEQGQSNERSHRRRDQVVVYVDDQNCQRIGVAPHPVYNGDEEDGAKLGLGDFIFYSILVGKAASYGDWNTTVACFIAILIGLSMTITLLAISRKALPALPISIAFGLLFYLASSTIIGTFTEKMILNQVYV